MDSLISITLTIVIIFELLLPESTVALRVYKLILLVPQIYYSVVNEVLFIVVYCFHCRKFYSISGDYLFKELIKL